MLTDYVSLNNITKIESLAMDMKQCVLFMVALHKSLLTT